MRASGCEEGGYARAAGTQALCQCALRRELDFELATEVHGDGVRGGGRRNRNAYCFSNVSFSPTYDAIMRLI